MHGIHFYQQLYKNANEKVSNGAKGSFDESTSTLNSQHLIVPSEGPKAVVADMMALSATTRRERRIIMIAQG